MKTKKLKYKKFRRGSLIGLILIIGVCLAILGWGMLHMGFGSRLNAAISQFSIDARISADAGLTDALYKMNLAYYYPASYSMPINGSGNLANSNGSYSFTLDSFEDYNYRIDSTGTSGRETRIVHAYTKRESFFDYALFVTNDMSINSKTLIDGYDSDVGPYDPDGANSGLPIEIGSNTTHPRQGPTDDGIFLHSDVEITGNIAVGPGVPEDDFWTEGGGDKGVIDGNPDSVTGSAYSLLEPYTWGNILDLMPPTYEYVHTTAAGELSDIIIESGNHLTIGNEDLIINEEGVELDRITPSWTIMCRDLDIKQGGILEIYGPPQPDPTDPNVPVVIYVTGDLLMGQGAQILLTNGYCLSIFVGEQFKSPAEGCLLTNMTTPDNPRPKYFEIFGISSEVVEWVLGNSETFYGVIYAPNANLTIHNSGEIFGSIAARNISLNNSGEIHYDMTLAQEAKYFAGYVINRWWEEVVH